MTQITPSTEVPGTCWIRIPRRIIPGRWSTKFYLHDTKGAVSCAQFLPGEAFPPILLEEPS